MRRKLPVPYRLMTREQKAEYRKWAYARHREAERKRSRAYQLANAELHHQRQRAWRKKNQKQIGEYNQARRHPCEAGCGRLSYNPTCRPCSDRLRGVTPQRDACPFCGHSKIAESVGCKDCLKRFGQLCHDSRLCCVAGKHKHCPRCSMPVKPATNHNRLEECAWCKADAARGAYMLAYQDSDDEEAAA